MAATTCSLVGQLDTWSLQRLADQTIVFPIVETNVSAATPAAQAGYGGLILYGPSAPGNLGSELASLRADVPYHLGLLTMTDEEGGGVQKMANLVGSMPWASQMGSTMSAVKIRELAESVARKMSANGVEMDLAPDIDVDGNAVTPSRSDPIGLRSFSGKNWVVAADGVAFMEGMVGGDVVPVVTHFPGLGGVSQDTAYGPATTLPWSTLEKVAVPTFEAAIKAGAPAVMVSNAIVQDLTSVPASLSSKLVTGELRDTLGFKGLIITDILSEAAISDRPLSLTVPEASVVALEAGDEMVLFGSTGSTSGDLSLAASTSQAIVTAVTDGKLPKAQLLNAVEEVLAAKKVNLCPGYWLTTKTGTIYAIGTAPFFGSLATTKLPSPIIGTAATPDKGGYWLVSAAGSVYKFGDAGFYGSEAGKVLPAPIVALTPTPDGRGYWLVSAKGNVYSFGDAGFYGSEAGKTLPAPIVGMASTLGGAGYWLVTSKGNVFGYGDAGFYGSEAGKSLPAPVVGLVPTLDSAGYWLVTSKGNVFGYGDTGSYGSLAGKTLPAPVVEMIATPDTRGYAMVTSKGNVYTFGDAPFYGSLAGKTLPSPVVSIAAG